MSLVATADGTCGGCGKYGPLRQMITVATGDSNMVCYDTPIECVMLIGSGAKQKVRARAALAFRQELPPAPVLDAPVVFRVNDQPRGQGSMVAIAEGVVAHDSKELMAWRALVGACYAKETNKRAPKGMPVELVLRFYFRKPASPTNPYPRNDLDKLVRAVCDGLKGLAYDDDSQVTQILASKTYGDYLGLVARVGPA